jgi:Spy/CpxP family protein refolding chaperone
MKTKKIVGFVIFFSLFVVCAMAQGQRMGGTPEERAAKTTERLKQQLNLTDEQVVKVQSLNLQFFKDLEQVRASGQDARAAMMEKVKAHDADLQKILTPEQYQKYLDSRKQMQGRMQNMQHSSNDAPAPQN